MKLSRNLRPVGAITTALGLAAVMQFAAAAQTPQTPPRPSPGAPSTAAPAQERTSPEQTVTVSGCIQREQDFRRARDAGRGGVAGTGVGAGNEFVLANAMMASGSPSGAAGATPSGTPGTTAEGSAFELTGANEGQAAQHVGKRVEITGRLKAAETTSGGAATGGATAGRPPQGVDVASKDLQLRELEITSIKAVAGTCPSM